MINFSIVSFLGVSGIYLNGKMCEFKNYHLRRSVNSWLLSLVFEKKSISVINILASCFKIPGD